MRSKIFIIAGGIIVMGLTAFLANTLSSKEPQGPVANSIYDFKLKSLDGKEIDFAKFKGKKLLIVNT
jgi:glutathione peroxidase